MPAEPSDQGEPPSSDAPLPRGISPSRNSAEPRFAQAIGWLGASSVIFLKFAFRIFELVISKIGESLSMRRFWPLPTRLEAPFPRDPRLKQGSSQSADRGADREQQNKNGLPEG